MSNKLFAAFGKILKHIETRTCGAKDNDVTLFSLGCSNGDDLAKISRIQNHKCIIVDTVLSKCFSNFLSHLTNQNEFSYIMFIFNNLRQFTEITTLVVPAEYDDFGLCECIYCGDCGAWC